jgi:CheY-like chemotaxis protein
MPLVSGFEVLEWVQGQPSLKTVLIFVLSSSPILQDIEKAKKLGAREYVVKTEYSGICAALADLNTRYFCQAPGK